VVRGGSWGAQGADCRAAVRIGYGENDRFDRVGFRVAMTVGR
jgi:formylglycine-generating enzyme required for sulfatase activity